VLAIATYVDADLRICEDEVAQVGDQAIARLCRPVSAEDAPLLLMWLGPILLLVSPEVRVMLAGLVEIAPRGKT
jgi:hypothetical protein